MFCPHESCNLFWPNSNDSLTSREQTAFEVATKQGLHFTFARKPYVAVEVIATKSCFDLLQRIQSVKSSQKSYLLHLLSIYFLKRRPCCISNKTLSYRHVFIGCSSFDWWVICFVNQLVYCRIHKSGIKDRILCHFGPLYGFAEGLFNVRGLVTISNKNKLI
jgi:hypothetical protein